MCIPFLLGIVCVCMCVWIGMWKWLIHFYSISFIACVVPVKRVFITHTIYHAISLGFGVFGFGSCCCRFLISSGATSLSVCNHTIVPVHVEKSWWILANISHKTHSQVRVIKGIASKCWHIKFKWKPPTPSTVLSVCTLLGFGLVCAAVVFSSISVGVTSLCMCNDIIHTMPVEKSWCF